MKYEWVDNYDRSLGNRQFIDRHDLKKGFHKMNLALSARLLTNMQHISYHFLSYLIVDDDLDHPHYSPDAYQGQSDEESVGSVEEYTTPDADLIDPENIKYVCTAKFGTA